MDINKLSFHNPTLGNLQFNQVVEELFNYINEKKDLNYEVIVGCDSSSEEQPNFPIALVVLRKGQGGRFFLTKVKYPQDRIFHTLRQRILEEVYLACDFALQFRDVFREKMASHSLDNCQFDFIHADVGGSVQTRDMIREVAGLVKSNGFEVKLKPESFAASVVADRYT